MSPATVLAVALIASSILRSCATPNQSSPTIQTAHNASSELATKAQLERLMQQYDLRPWTYTREVVIDDSAIPHSHPVLTLHTRHLKQDDELLSTYVHEQLHWYLSAHASETNAAESDLTRLYPDVPVGFPEAQDRESTYLHLLVCLLEERADEALLGEERTKNVMNFWAGDHYRWVYRTVIQDGPKLEEILRAHHLRGPRTKKMTKDSSKP
jgi:hypothetical protein